jgi:flagellin-like protein
VAHATTYDFRPVSVTPTMQLKQFLDDDRAVSPVIGVILMVAITVILAAVIGTFVLGLGDQVSQTTPSASFQFDYDRNENINDTLTITHNGGDTLSTNEVTITANDGFRLNDSDASPDWNGDGSVPWANVSSSGSDISAGSSATINSEDMRDYTVRVVWQAAEGDSSAQLGTWNGPNA